jgi:hypothetical protein
LLLGCGDPPDPTPVPEQDPNAGPPGKHPGKPDPRQPTAQTIAAVDALTQPLEVGVFMDGSGRGKDDAIAYFEALVAARDDVQLVKLEAGSGLTSRFAGSRNRGVVLKVGEAKEHLEFVQFAGEGGDAQVRRALTKLARPALRIHALGDGVPEDPRPLQRIAASFGAKLQIVAPEEAVPDTDVLIVLQRGPLPPQRRTELASYLAKGRGLILAIEPSATESAEGLLQALSLKSADGVIGRTATGDAAASGRIDAHAIATDRSVANVAKLGKTLAVALASPGTLELLQSGEAKPKLILLPDEGDWLDQNADGQRGPDEPSAQGYGWAAVVELGSGRVWVIADVDALLDPLLSGSPSNTVLLRDAIRWTSKH